METYCYTYDYPGSINKKMVVYYLHERAWSKVE